MSETRGVLGILYNMGQGQVKDIAQEQDSEHLRNGNGDSAGCRLRDEIRTR